MGLLNSLAKVYPGKWQVIDSEEITNETLENILSVSVKPSDYGLSVCFALKSGGYMYVPYSNDSEIKENLSKDDLLGGQILRLHRAGDDDILRIKLK